MKEVWKISNSNDERFSKYLKKCKHVESNYNKKKESLKNSNDPKSKADELALTKNFGRVWIIKVTKSYRFAYQINEKEKLIIPICIGDHKLIYGKD